VPARSACAPPPKLDDAGLGSGALRAERLGVALGTTLGGVTLRGVGHGGRDGGPERAVLRARRARVARGRARPRRDATARASGARGRAGGVDPRGPCDVVLAGGTDLLCRFVVAGFNCLRATSDVSRPFDARRKGLVSRRCGGPRARSGATHAAARVRAIALVAAPRPAPST
jgi:3-oxoacyl-(acyl-carrier-protein) synthase